MPPPTKSIYTILILSLLFTVIIQLDLTQAIVFDNYLNTKQVSGFNYYLSLINESSKGNWQLGSPYLSEWRYQPYLYPALNIHAAGLFKSALGLDVKFYALITGYLAVFVIMALLINAFLVIFNFHYFGYLAAAAYIFIPRLDWGRTLSPEINFIPLALFFIFYFSNLKFWKREIGLAVLAGSLFYVYPYYWTFALALLAASDCWMFWQARKIIWKYLYKYLIIAGVASWYVIHLLQISQLAYYKESMVRIGALYSRWPAGLYTQAFLIASLIAFFVLRKYIFPKLDMKAVTEGTLDKIAMGLVAGLMVLNQQIITGMQLEFNSHYLPTLLFFFVAFWGGIVFIVSNYFGSYKKIATAIFILVAVGMAANKAYLIISDPQINNPATAETYVGGRADAVVDWFLANQIRDKVVYAPKDLGNDINLLTNNYLYFHPSQELQLMPTEELLDRYIYWDVTYQYITDNLEQQQTRVFGQAFNSALQKDNVINKIKAKILGRDFTPATLLEYTPYDFGPIRAKRLNPDPVEFNHYLEKYHVDYLVYYQKDKDLIYKQVPGEIVFEDDSYIVKKRQR
ncbi:MAG: hypothetical protein Q8P76_03490 [bacterium]|nr:hypothetical protein [bacterium]